MGLWKTWETLAGWLGPPPKPPTPEDTSTQYAILKSNLGWRARVNTWEPPEWEPGGDYPGGWRAGRWYGHDLTPEGWPAAAPRILPTREAAEAAIAEHRSGASTWREVDSIV